ncbi:nuclear transport factor 2 family protein [Massilia sp. DWR3-1-1]|uniref:nuclear transport factor 2 family protein n=1 Tax=Massilia sp. DWR3-1-1 TaxID=2804559 RepID=UPI003CF917E8
MSQPSPLALIESQFDAYNARDLDAFMAHFADDIKVIRMPAATLAMQGKAALSHFYATERFNVSALRAELINRIVSGTRVFDHERIWGVADTPIEMVVVFEVSEGLITTMWTFPA